MSYVLHLWEHPVPASVGDADRIHARLSSERAAQNPKFIELARRLTARYPCIATMDDDAEAAWSDGPLDGRTDSAVYSLGVNTDMLDKVVPFVVSTASELGLVVYDMQAGEVHVPGGKALTLPGRAPAAFEGDVPAEALQSKGQVAEVIREGLRGLMEDHGFKSLKGAVFFKKRLKTCSHEVVFDIVESYRSYDLGMFYRVVPHLDPRLEDVVRSCTIGACFLDLAKVGEMAARPAPGNKKNAADRCWVVDTLGRLRMVVDGLRDFLAAAVLPVMSKCESIEELDHLVNSRLESDQLFVQDNIDILVAYAANNPVLASLIEARLRAAQVGYETQRLRQLLSALNEPGSH